MNGSTVTWAVQNILFLMVKYSNIEEINTTLCFACQINISLKIINKLKFLGVPQNFPHWMGELLTHKED